MKKFAVIGVVVGVVITTSLLLLVYKSHNPSSKLKSDANSTQKIPSVNTQITDNSTNIKLNIPSDVQIGIFAKDIDSARDLLWINDSLLVSQPSKGQIVSLTDEHNNGWSTKQVVVVNKLNRPHGLAYKDSLLYVAETDKVSVYEYNPESKIAKFQKKLYDLPSGGMHWTRSLLIQNNQLFVSVGSSCNVCNEKDLSRAAILVSDISGNGLRVFASGSRNAVFMTTDPKTGKVIATENSRDNLGDDVPPDEINIIEDNHDYGWPYCFGKNIYDKTFIDARYKSYLGDGVCAQLGKTESFIDIPAHSAPLGLQFFPDSWPKKYAGNLLVALHGSWNRSVPTGYKLIMVSMDLFGNPVSQDDFISGWLNDREVQGRPVDVEFDTNGHLYVSDDKTGNIYVINPKLEE